MEGRGGEAVGWTGVEKGWRGVVKGEVGREVVYTRMEWQGGDAWKFIRRVGLHVR